MYMAGRDKDVQEGRSKVKREANERLRRRDGSGGGGVAVWVEGMTGQ